MGQKFFMISSSHIRLMTVTVIRLEKIKLQQIGCTPVLILPLKLLEMLIVRSLLSSKFFQEKFLPDIVLFQNVCLREYEGKERKNKQHEYLLFFLLRYCGDSWDHQRWHCLLVNQEIIDWTLSHTVCHPNIHPSSTFPEFCLWFHCHNCNWPANFGCMLWWPNRQDRRMKQRKCKLFLGYLLEENGSKLSIRNEALDDIFIVTIKAPI